jgi:hypothetical protein
MINDKIMENMVLLKYKQQTKKKLTHEYTLVAIYKTEPGSVRI